MEEQIFISPAVKFSEKDLTFVNETLNQTSFGLVGETPQGPAFEPITITNKQQFSNIFGNKSTEKIGQDLKYLANYYGFSFLEESNNLTVTRVLGLIGYDAGTGWAITLDAAPDLTTLSGTSSTVTTSSFTGGTLFDFDLPTTTGTTTTGRTDFIRVSDAYTATTYTFEVLTINSDLSGTTQYTAVTQTAQPLAEYDKMVLGIVRSRADYNLNDKVFRATGLTISSTGNTANVDLLGEFILDSQGANSEQYIVSLDKNKRSFISNVLGSKPKGKENNLYVEAVYPELISKLNADGLSYGVSTSLTNLTTDVFKDYNAQWKTPQTPYVVSELRGNEVERLFRFISISDGDFANQQIKITIQNIDLTTGEFSVIIRDFNDTDDNPVILETFSRCTMNPDDSGYIGKRIGGIDSTGEAIYSFNSSYVYVELNEDADILSIPCGFEGYTLRNYSAANTGSSAAKTPKIFYKTSYTDNEKVRKVYLGLSETAFGLESGLNQNLFNYTGAVTRTSAYTKTEGFHLDSGATGTYTVGTFQTGGGNYRVATDLLNEDNPYAKNNTAKFTLVPYGGFDGWDVHRTQRTINGVYKQGGSLYFQNSDYEAYLQGIQTFSNAEETTINIFSVAGVNFDEHIELVNEALDMVEDDRLGDSIYIIDAPDLPNTNGLAEEYADLIDSTNLDTSYACTYAPWIRTFDEQNGSNVFIPPTGEVAKSMAFTDRVTGPWFAPAGLNRGVINANNVRRRVSLVERDTLYGSRINPITYFKDTGIAIFGQKTLQKRESALDRINVRRLLIYLRQVIANIAVRLIFDQNDDVLRDDFKNKVNPILQRVQRERGLSVFKIVMHSTNNTPEVIDRKEVRGEIIIQPTPSAEFFNIGFTLVPTGVNIENI